MQTSDRPMTLKDGRSVRLATYRPEDKEALVSMYASMSPEAIKWGLPPYDRPRIERWTTDLTNNITLLARLAHRIVGHLQLFRIPLERLKRLGHPLIYIHQDFPTIRLATTITTRAI